MKKKTLLQNLCNNLLEKNCELYLKHEEMLDEEDENGKDDEP